MLGLTLRREFQGQRLKGTAIELASATQGAAADFLRITYPTTDVLKTIEAAGPDQGRPVILVGERGQGKSHIMAALCHALNDTSETSQWLARWAQELGNPKLTTLPLRSGMHVISESLHRQRYKHLWDLLFECHPDGAHCRGLWEGLGDKKTDIPSDKILLQMFSHTPTALILDEYQTWFDGLTNTKQFPWRTWAFNFIQLLSEIAKEHPDKLLLVVSVRNGGTNAFQQIQRVNPVIVDFKGPEAKHDRLRLLLHRLFENRMQVPPAQVESTIAAHVGEYIRLLNVPPAEQDRVRREFCEAWPFAPHMIQLLEDQVLIATHAQETRDLIRILADLYKRGGDKSPIITAADFRIDDEQSGITALLDSVANQHHAKLREKALRNLEAVRSAVASTGQTLPHLEEILSALWLRSLANVNQAGADQHTLHVDITRSSPVDDNAFQVELSTIVENSFNIHSDGGRFIFRGAENPQAKLIASARNDRLFQDGEDMARLALETRYVIGGDASTASKFRVVVLPRFWKNDPWTTLDEAEQPARWDDRIPLLVVPEANAGMEATLGQWLRSHLQSNRNVVRFLMPPDGAESIFTDRNLLILARCVYLAEEWKGQNPEYGKLMTKYQHDLRALLKVRFPRFAVIHKWHYQEPKNCRFHIENHRVEGAQIPDAVDHLINENLFVPEDFDALALATAANNDTVGKLLKELREPRPGGEDCIPWLGETLVKERLIRLCARGKMAINLRGMEYLQRQDGESEDSAWRRMRGKLGTGKHLDETHLLLPQNVPSTGGVTPPLPTGDGTLPIQPTGDGTTPPTPTPDGGTVYPPDTSGGTTPSIFDGAGTFKPLAAPATSSLNLLGKIENWGIGPGTQVRAFALKVDHLTGAQLQDLIRKLPDGITYELNIEKEEA
jgi:hypothetical protein